MTVRTIDDIFRDFVNDGMPASGPFHPYKPDIRDTLKKLLEGISTFPDNRVIRLNNANTGTANNIIVTASVAIPAAAYQVLYILNVTQANTGPVKVSGAISRNLVTNTSATVPSGYLTPGMAVLCIDTGSELRMLSYGDMETIIADAEEALAATIIARDAAELARDEAVAAASDAVSQGNVPIYSTRNAVEGLNIPTSINAFRTNGFANVGDGGHALYMRVASEPTHAGKVQSDDGAWWEIVGDEIDFRCFGASFSGDNDNAWSSARSWATETDGILQISEGAYHYAYNSDFSGVRVKASGEVVFVSKWTSMPPVIKVMSGVVNFQCDNPDFKSLVNSASPAQPADFLGVVTDTIDEVATIIPPLNMLAYSVPWTGTIGVAPSALTAGFSHGGDVLTFDLSSSAIPGASFVYGLMPVEIGALVEADVRVWSGANNVKCIVLSGEQFTTVVWLDPSKSTFAPTVYYKNHLSGASGSFTLWNVHGDFIQSGMSFDNGVLGVRFLSGSLAQITVNGVGIGYVGAVVGQYTGYGFGVYKASSSGSVSVNHPVKTWGATIPVAPAKVLTFGDSITDGDFNTWPRHALAMMNGANGLFVANRKNIAKSGETAAQQLAKLQSENVGNYNIVIGMVGTNDIQAQTDITAFKTTITDIINRATSGGAVLILGVPSQYYSRANAGNYGVVGADPINSDKGALYRTAIASEVARAAQLGKAVSLVNLGRLAPVNLAQHLRSKYPLTPDNIHPSGGMASLIARAFVRGLNGFLRGDAIKSGAFSLLAGRFWRNGWAAASGFQCYHLITKDLRKRLVINASGSTVTNGTTILNLPPMLRPTNVEYRAAVTSTGACRIEIAADGNVKIYGVTGYVCFEAEYR